MTSLPGMKKNNRAAKYILLVFKVLLYQQTLNINFGKQTVQLRKDFTKVSRVGLLFDFNLQYRSIYATFELLAQFLFASVLWKWNNNYSGVTTTTTTSFICMTIQTHAVLQKLCLGIKITTQGNYVTLIIICHEHQNSSWNIFYELYIDKVIRRVHQLIDKNVYR